MPGARESMWADGRGRYYDVIPSGDQHFAVRTCDGAGRVVRYTKHLIRREASTGKWLWQGAHRTFELDARGESLVWRCRAGGRSFTWTPTLPINKGLWPYPLQEEHGGVKNQGAAALPDGAGRWPASTAGALRSGMALCESSRRIQARADAKLKCATSPLVWLEARRRLKEECGSAQASPGGRGPAGPTFVDVC